MEYFLKYCQQGYEIQFLVADMRNDYLALEGRWLVSYLTLVIRTLRPVLRHSWQVLNETPARQDAGRLSIKWIILKSWDLFRLFHCGGEMLHE